MDARRQVQEGARAPSWILSSNFLHETSIHSSLKMALTILLQVNRDDARLFSTEGLGEHQFFSLISMYCNKKVGAVSHRLHIPAKNSAGAHARGMRDSCPLMTVAL